MSDLHVGAKPRNEKIIYNDIIDAFNESMDLIIREKPNLLIIAGDLFDTPKPDNDSLKIVINRFKEVTNHDIPIILAHGEHDTPGRKESTILQVLSSAISNVYAPLYESKGNEDENTMFLNIVKESKISTKNIDIYVYPYKKINLDMRKNLADKLLKIYDKEIRSNGNKSVFVAHFSIDPYLLFDAVADVQKLPNANYIALGHIHERIINKKDKFFVYPGSLYPLSISEIKHKNRGPILVDLSKDEPDIQELKINLRDNLFARISIEDEKDIINKLRAGIEVKIRETLNKNKQPIVYLDIEKSKDIYARSIIQAITKIENEFNVHIIPEMKNKEKKESSYSVKALSRSGLDPFNILVNELKLGDNTAKLLLDLRDATLEGDESKIVEVLDKLSKESLDELKRLI